MIKGMIFDLDGTTIDTLNDIKESFNKALEEFGYPRKSRDEIRMGVGRGFRMLVNAIVPEGVSEEKKEEIAARYKNIYRENYYKTSFAYSGMNVLIKELQEQGIKLAVNSNKSDEFTTELIRRNYPDISFVAVIGAREGVPHKPDPSTALEIADMMKLDPEEIAYVGDSDIDMMTGKNAGMKTIGVLWGYRDEKILKENGADHTVKTPEEIKSYL